MPTEQKENEHRAKGTFWGALIGGVLVSLLTSGGVSLGVTSSQAQTMDEKQKFQKLLIQQYLDDALLPRIETSQARLEKRLEEGISQCLEKAGEADKQAYAALEGLRMRFGARTVSRAIETAEREIEREKKSSPKPSPLSSEPSFLPTEKPQEKTLPLPKFEQFQQQSQLPARLE